MAFLASVFDPFETLRALGALSLPQEPGLRADTVSSIEDEGRVTDTLVGLFVPVSGSGALNTVGAISSDGADAVLSVPEGFRGKTVTGVLLVVPDSGGWAGFTIVTISFRGA